MAIVKNQNKGYAGDFGTMTNQVAGDNAEAKKKEQPDASGKKPPKDPKQNIADSMAEKSNYGGSNSMAESNKFAKAVQDAKAAGDSTFEVGGKTYNVTGK